MARYSTPSVKNFLKPTPAFMVRLGDALMAVSTTITAAAISGDHKVLAYISLGAGVLGIFLTRLFTVKNEHSAQADQGEVS